METIKVIELSHRIIFVDDILTIYKKDEWGEYQKINTNYYITTKYGNISVAYSDYKKVEEYLLSLNEPIYEDIPKEDKKIEKLESLNTDYYMEREKYGTLTNEEIVLDIQTLKKYINKLIDKKDGE